MYKWYQGFEAEHFPDPKGLRDTVARCTLHIYPKCIKAAMALFDVPEAIAVSRTQICSAGGIKDLSRLQVSSCLILSFKCDQSSCKLGLSHVLY